MIKVSTAHALEILHYFRISFMATQLIYYLLLFATCFELSYIELRCKQPVSIQDACRSYTVATFKWHPCSFQIHKIFSTMIWKWFIIAFFCRSFCFVLFCYPVSSTVLEFLKVLHPILLSFQAQPGYLGRPDEMQRSEDLQLLVLNVAGAVLWKFPPNCNI